MSYVSTIRAERWYARIPLSRAVHTGELVGWVFVLVAFYCQHPEGISAFVAEVGWCFRHLDPHLLGKHGHICGISSVFLANPRLQSCQTASSMSCSRYTSCECQMSRLSPSITLIWGAGRACLGGSGLSRVICPIKRARVSPTSTSDLVGA